MKLNHTGQLCSVDLPTPTRPAHPPAVLQTTTDDDRKKTPASRTIPAN